MTGHFTTKSLAQDKRIRTGYGSLLSNALENICHAILHSIVSGQLKVTVCTATLLYGKVSLRSPFYCDGFAFAWTTYGWWQGFKGDDGLKFKKYTHSLWNPFPVEMSKQFKL